MYTNLALATDFLTRSHVLVLSPFDSSSRIFAVAFLAVSLYLYYSSLIALLSLSLSRILPLSLALYNAVSTPPCRRTSLASHRNPQPHLLVDCIIYLLL